MTYKKIQSFIFLVLMVAMSFLLLYIFWPYVNGLVFALILGIIFWPLHEKVLAWCKNKASLAALISVIVVILAIVAPFAFITSQAAREVGAVYEEMTSSQTLNKISLVHNLEKNLSNYFGVTEINFESVAQSGANWIAKNVGAIFSSATQLIINLLIGVIALYYVFKEGDYLRSLSVRLSPLSDKYDQMIIDKIGAAVHSVIRGAIIIAIIQGILTGLGLFLFGVPNYTLWGSIAALSSLIPNVGTALVVVPAIVYLFAIGKMSMAIGLLLWGFIAVGLIDNFLGPQFMKKGLVVNPLLILLSILGGITSFGPLGFVLGPLIISVFVVLIDIYKTEFKDYLETQKE